MTAGTSKALAQIRISEFLASNNRGLEDEDGDRSDWIELENPTDAAVNLDGWRLTDDSSGKQFWQLPAVELKAHSFLVVFASGKDRKPAAGPLHSNFRLNKSGEYLALLRPGEAGPTTVFAPRYPPQYDDVSHGPSGFFRVPTPGSPNGTAFEGVLGPTDFSHPRGFFNSEFELKLTSSDGAATIRYTLDGSDPEKNAAAVYSGPITIRTTTIVRAVAVRSGWVSGPRSTHSYLFPRDIVRQTGDGFPTKWGQVNADYAMDSRVTEDPQARPWIEEDLKSIPTISITVDRADFFGPQGLYSNATIQDDSFEKPCSMEFLARDSRERDFQVECGLRMAGGASRSTLSPKHGMRLVFRSEFGSTQLREPLFGTNAAQSFDSIALRPNFNMSWVRTDNSGPLLNGNADGAERTHAIYVRDQWTKDSFRAMGQPAAHQRFVHLYINGLYWGLYNPSERVDAGFAAAYHGGSKEEYDAIFSDFSAVARAADGDRKAWDAMMTIARSGVSKPENYERLKGILDVTNLADYMMLNFYAATVDWPWQNWIAYRRRTPEAQFRFTIWDAEYTLETPPWVPLNITGVGKLSYEQDGPAGLYNHLRSNAEWRVLFGDRVHRHFTRDGALTTSRASARFVDHCDEIDGAIVGESARWGDVVRKGNPYRRDPEWLSEKNRLLNRFFPGRTTEMISQFRAADLYPKINAPFIKSNERSFLEEGVLELSAETPTILFTLSGNDPRAVGGEKSADAQEYSSAIRIEKSVKLKARVWSGAEWSALLEADLVVTSDSDGDGMDDVWESANGLNSRNPKDSLQDLDADGVSNVDEYRAGTNPRDVMDRPGFQSVQFTSRNRIQAGFRAVAGREYRVQKSQRLLDGSTPWEDLAVWPAVEESRDVRTRVEVGPGMEFLRLLVIRR